MSGIRDLSFSFSSKILLLILGIASQSCLAWILGPSERGSYAVCLLYSVILSLIFLFDCEMASVYLISSKRFSVSEGITHTLIYGGVGSIVAIVVGIIVMQIPLSIFQKASPVSFYLGLITIPVSLYSTVFMRLLTAVKRFDWNAVMLVINGALQLAFTILFVWVLKWGVNGAILAIILTGLCIIAVVLYFFRTWYNFSLQKPSFRDILEMFHYGIRSYVGKISNQVNFQMGTIILLFFATTEEIGLFSVASQLTSRCMIIPDTIIGILIPRVAGDKEGRKDLVAQCFRLTGLICGGLLVILIIFAYPLVYVLLSPAFLPTVPLVRIIAAGFIIRSMCKVFESYLVGTNHPGKVSMSTAVGMLVNLSMLVVLMPVIRLYGAALGMVGGFVVGSAMLFSSFLKYSGMSIDQLCRFTQKDFEGIIKIFKKGKTA